MTVIPADTAPPANRPGEPPRARSGGADWNADREAADRFAAALRRHDKPREAASPRAGTPMQKRPAGEDRREERGAFAMPQAQASAGDGAAAQPAGTAPVLEAAADIAAVPAELVSPEKLAAMVDRLFMSADGDETLMMRFSDIFSPLEGVKVTRGEGGALGLHLTANAVHMPRLQAQIDRLRERLLVRGHRIGDIEIDVDSDPAARLRTGDARW